jgi:hypothetical protein
MACTTARPDPPQTGGLPGGRRHAAPGPPLGRPGQAAPPISQSPGTSAPAIADRCLVRYLATGPMVRPGIRHICGASHGCQLAQS